MNLPNVNSGGLTQSMLVNFQKWLFAAGLAVLLVSCRGGAKPVRLGEYRGTKDGIVEVLDLKQDGTFEHSAFKGSERLWSESGRYSLSPDTVHLTEFTQIYDPIDHSVNPNGKKFGSYTLTHIEVGGYSELKDDVEQDCSLTPP